jgi:hypothetical protein
MGTLNGVYLFRTCDVEIPAECSDWGDAHVCERDWLHDDHCRCQCGARWEHDWTLPGVYS